MISSNMQLWIWLGNALIIVMLATIAIIDGVRDWYVAEAYSASTISPEAIRRVARRNIRNGVITFTIGNLAGSLALLRILGVELESPTLLGYFRDWLPYALNLILFLIMIMLLWDRYERWRVFNPNRRLFERCKRFLAWCRFWNRVR